ncbi:hypothetical protein WMY93_027050 [Mugilogobius chulae]|uniref:SEFIR domain-containing protein n=1 Tax=Mugilogobius chulae TaxID=88201 RepID=A0AAW0MW82_9GOBI
MQRTAKLQSLGSSVSDIKVSCSEFYEFAPDSLTWAPSLLADLRAGVTPDDGGYVLNISWAIAVDSTVTYLEATVIDTSQETLKCEYIPALAEVDFSQTQDTLIWFHHTEHVLYADVYHVKATNTPLPAPESVPHRTETWLCFHQDQQVQDTVRSETRHSQVQVQRHVTVRSRDTSQSGPGWRHVTVRSRDTSQSGPGLETRHSQVQVQRHVTVRYRSRDTSQSGPGLETRHSQVQVQRHVTVRSRSETRHSQVQRHVTVSPGPETRHSQVQRHVTVRSRSRDTSQSGPGPETRHSQVQVQRHVTVRFCPVSTITPAAPGEGEEGDSGSLYQICVGLIVCVTLLLCGGVLYKICHSGFPSDYLKMRPALSGPALPVLLVYPGQSALFQRAVGALADFLQQNGGCNVTIDMWQQGSVAKLGPMRWLLEQVEAVHRVIIVAPQPSPRRPHPRSRHPAAAQDLYALALNLVASQAKKSEDLAKFWVVRFDKNTALTSELKACRTFSLMNDLNKLCRCLHNHKQDGKMKIANLVLRGNYSGGASAEKLQAAVQALNQKQQV